MTYCDREFSINNGSSCVDVCRRVQVAYQLFLIITVYFVPLVLMAAAYTSIAICLWSTVIPSETVSSSSGKKEAHSIINGGTRRRLLLLLRLYMYSGYFPVEGRNANSTGSTLS